jgi:uncharacterized protein (TIGR02611 family)
MIERLRKHWREFKGSEPGHRFQKRYYRRRQDEKGHVLIRVFNIALGVVIAGGSLVLAPLPGPGFLTVFVGLAIVAGELLYAARFLDWAEVTLRRLGRFVRDVWRRSVLGKVGIVVVAAALATAAGYAAYYVLFA